jgi:hypothetical protein
MPLRIPLGRRLGWQHAFFSLLHQTTTCKYGSLVAPCRRITSHHFARQYAAFAANQSTESADREESAPRVDLSAFDPALSGLNSVQSLLLSDFGGNAHWAERIDIAKKDLQQPRRGRIAGD